MSETTELLTTVRNILREEIIDANDVYVATVPPDAEMPYLVVTPGLANQTRIAQNVAAADESVQIDCYDWTLVKANALAEGVVNALNGHSVAAEGVIPRGLRAVGNWRVIFPTEVTTTGRQYTRVSLRLSYEMLRQQEI
jgi:hypothetical protein